MNLLAAVLTMLQLKTAAIEPGSVVTVLPENPHAYMKKRICTSCHDVWIDDMLPHEFVVDVVEFCRECHPREQLGRSHPVNIEPDDSEYDIEVPDAYPLHDEMVTCGTCHEPHVKWLSRTRSFPSQEPFVILEEANTEVAEEILIEYFKTYFLRASDPVDGFTPLCLGCHRDY